MLLLLCTIVYKNKTSEKKEKKKGISFNCMKLQQYCQSIKSINPKQRAHYSHCFCNTSLCLKYFVPNYLKQFLIVSLI